MILIQVLIVLILVIVHLFSGNLRFLDVIPRSRWLSMAGGASVAYVFLHIFPDLSNAQVTVTRMGSFGLRHWENHVYIAALLGLIIFYGLERMVIISRQANLKQVGENITSPSAFWLHILSFSVYNALIGYLLVHREIPGLRSLVLFGFAMALHFVVNDFGLREDHKEAYTRIGRWILSFAIALGWGIGKLVTIHAGILAVLFAFLAGGVILNTLKEELPEERASRFDAFALGAVIYAVILLIR